MLTLGIFLVVYGIAVFMITILKPEKIWKMGKIRGFVKILGHTGTVILFYIVSTASLAFGIYFMIRHWPG